MKIKSLKQVLAEHDDKDVQRVIRAVVRRVGRESIGDIVNYGIDGGYGGFIYYCDTVGFWKKYRSTIRRMLEDDALDMCVGVIEMVQHFGCICHGELGKPNPDYTTNEVGRAVYGSYDDDLDMIYNALAWYAAETVCRWFEE